MGQAAENFIAGFVIGTGVDWDNALIDNGGKNTKTKSQP